MHVLSLIWVQPSFWAKFHFALKIKHEILKVFDRDFDTVWIEILDFSNQIFRLLGLKRSTFWT